MARVASGHAIAVGAEGNRVFGCRSERSRLVHLIPEHQLAVTGAEDRHLARVEGRDVPAVRTHHAAGGVEWKGSVRRKIRRGLVPLPQFITFHAAEMRTDHRGLAVAGEMNVLELVGRAFVANVE